MSLFVGERLSVTLTKVRRAVTILSRMFQGTILALSIASRRSKIMVTSNLSQHWYDGLSTDELVQMLPVAKERAEFTPDRLEKELWKIRVERMEMELLRRQHKLDEFEV
jgi:hypothetical protein